MDFPDRSMTVGGTVKRKWQEDGEKRVDMDIAVETQLGPAYRCSGTLALPSIGGG